MQPWAQSTTQIANFDHKAVHQTGEVQQSQQANGLISLPHAISILVVDDQPRNLIAVEAALASVECDIVTTNSGHGALQCVLAQDFAVIVLDIQMPIMDGFETASLIRARQRSRSTPVIFLTAHDPDGLRVPEGYRLGAVDYIYTPVDPYVLRSKVTAFVELFRAALANEESTAGLHQIAVHELLDVNGQLVLAGLKAEDQAEVQIALRGEAETALNARDEFVSITARELRTPVMGIMANAQLAMDALADAAPDRELIVLGCLQGIVGSADGLLSLTNSLTDEAGMRNRELPLPPR
jgi:CheY-like chemotaxis protein